MNKSKELKDYLQKEKEEKERIEREFFELMNDLDGSNLTVVERRVKLREFVKLEKAKQTMFVRYSNFIMDVRKPSFWFFIMWFCFSIVGFIAVLAKIIKWF